MRLYKFIGLFLMCCWLGEFAEAKTLQVTLQLAEIRVEKTSEEGGDELYFNVTQYSSLGSTQNTRVPAYPSHWPSQKLHKVKNALLWEGSIKEGEEVQLIISLLEQDSPPWDNDEGIGSATLTLNNAQGKLRKKWEIPAFAAKKEVEQLKDSNPQGYIFKGTASRYDVAFLIKQK